MRKGTKRILGLGLLAGAGYAVWRAMERARVDTGMGWRPRPFPYPPEPVPDPLSGTTAEAPAPEPSDGAWVDPTGGECPTSHPVKAKLTSGIFHEPGGANYARTQADRCYRSPDAAEADGLRAAKR
jgi:hypothetical protein